MTAAWLVRGDARRLPLASGSVQAIVTSPPYFSLRAYQTTPVEWSDGTRYELGSEPTPALFVAHLVEVMRECWRVLRDDGVAFVNMGDSYQSNGARQTGRNDGGRPQKGRGWAEYDITRVKIASDDASGTRPKSLLLVPERLAIALADDGWIVRSRIAWCKAAPMPESVRDRPSTAWEHIWMLTKSAKYYWDADAVREPQAEPGRGLGTQRVALKDERPEPGVRTGTLNEIDRNGNQRAYNPAGRNLWNYWVLNPDPYPGAHFATFPREIPRRCILAATSEYGACAACGAPYRRDIQRTTNYIGKAHDAKYESAAYLDHYGSKQAAQINGDLPSAQQTTTGWAPACRCEEIFCGQCSSTPQRRAMDLRGVQRRDNSHMERETTQVLQSAVQGQVVDQPPEVSDLVDQDEEGLHRGLPAQASLRIEAGICAGAPASNGASARSVSGAERSSESQERDQGRQPIGEPGSHDETGSRPSAQTIAQDSPDRMPALRRGNHDHGSCPLCGGPLVCRPYPVRPQIVLDPFSGSGTVAYQAARMGRVGIGVELSAEYVAQARYGRLAQDFLPLGAPA